MGQQFQLANVKPAPNTAILYIYRPSAVGGIMAPDHPVIHVNGKKVGEILINGYRKIVLKPGNHILHVNDSTDFWKSKFKGSSIDITLKDQEVRYVKFELNPVMGKILSNSAAAAGHGTRYYRFPFYTVFKSVSPQQGRTEISETRRVGK